MATALGTIASHRTAAVGGGPSYFTGGVEVDAAGYRYHRFDSSGTLTLVGPGPVAVEYLVVAGGGGGGARRAGGGGGAGGYLAASASLTATQTVTIGAGGAGGPADSDIGASSGSSSSLGAVSAVGGGGGGTCISGTTVIGLDGGSGGGGSNRANSTAGPGSAGGVGTVGQGNNGGTGILSSSNAVGQAGAGGGGAGAVGADVAGDISTATSGAGGVGLQWLNGSFYAGGGGGGDRTGGPAASGGAGGGGAGNPAGDVQGIPGTPNTGGGGGGTGSTVAGYFGGTGGSGAVIVRYPTPGSPPDGSLLPNAIPGLLAWWDAADTATLTIPLGDGKVSQWNDKSGLGNHLTQSMAANQFTSGVRTVNGRNVLESGPSVAMSMLIASITLPQPVTLVFMTQSDDIAATRYMQRQTLLVRSVASNWQMNAGTTLAAGAADTNANVHICSFNGATSTYHLNNVVRATGNAGVNGLVATTFRLGDSSVAGTWDGVFGEAIVYDHVLTTTERNGLSSYLKTKWATP